MDTFQNIFFESPLMLAIFCFAFFAIVLLGRKRIESEKIRRRMLPITLLIIVALFILQATVTTRREELLQRLNQFVTAIELPNKPALIGFISPDYDAEDLDQQSFDQTLQRWLDRVDVYDVRLRRRDIAFDGDSAKLDLGAMATVSIDGRPGEQHVGTWIIHWRNEEGVWRITSIKPVMVDGFEIDKMRPYLP